MADRDPLSTLLRDGLDGVAVEAPADEGLDAVHHRHGRRVRRRRALAGACAVVLVCVGAVAFAALRTDEERPQRVVTEPAPAVGAVGLDPAGPYTDGQQVSVVTHGFQAADLHNDPPRLCATVDGVESCDPLWESTFVLTPLRQVTFTASGWRDCADADVDCRIVVAGADGRAHESERLRFTGEGAPPAVTLSVGSPDGGGSLTDRAVLTPDGLEADPSWVRWRAEVPDDLPPFVVQVCAFGGRDHDVCDMLDYPAVLDPDDPERPVDVPVEREIFGFGGWRDCATTPCYLVVRATYVVEVDAEGSTLAGDRAVAAAPVRFDPATPAEPRPSITVLDDGPFAPDASVSVRVEHLPRRWSRGISVALCRRDLGIVGGCIPRTLAAATEGTTVVTLPGESCRPDECELALLPDQEGSPPFATAPIELRP